MATWLHSVSIDLVSAALAEGNDVDDGPGRRILCEAAMSIRLEPGRKSGESMDFEGGMRRKIVGQDEAVQAVVDLYQVFRAGLNSPGRPVGNLLFLGPTGAGK